MDLPKLDEPVGLRARVAIEPDAVRADISSGRFIATPVWKAWGTDLAGARVDRATLTAILRGYDYEVWLWAVGERTWAQCVEGMAGRLRRRLGAAPRKAKPTKAKPTKAKPTKAKPTKAKAASKTTRAGRPKKATKAIRAGAARRTSKGDRAAKATRTATRTRPKKATKATKARIMKARTTKARTTNAATVGATRALSGGKKAAKAAKTTRARKAAGPARKTRRR